jgi:xanthine dehydrogenase small subunit
VESDARLIVQGDYCTFKEILSRFQYMRHITVIPERSRSGSVSGLPCATQALIPRMQDSVQCVLDGRLIRIPFTPSSAYRPTTTVLQYLRSLPGHRGAKEGCAEGDCGACTVVLAEESAPGALTYSAVDSCLVFLPMVHGKHLITVENLRDKDGALHPVQRALVALHGSQCGFCTPGIVMSLFALYKSGDTPDRASVVDALAGNLCRCTGYRSVIEAALEACAGDRRDHFTDEETAVCSLLGTIPRETLFLNTGAQRYCRPSTLEEALAYRAEHPEALVLCGATDVALRVTKKHEQLSSILDLSGIPSLRTVCAEAGTLAIGSAVTLQDLLTATREACEPLGDMLGVFGSRQIRSMATLGGNLGTASPVSDTLPVLLALQAGVRLEKSGQWRMVAVENFVTGYRHTACGKNELITSIVIPEIPKGTIVRSYKISRRRDMDISSVSACFRLALDGTEHVSSTVLAFGGMAATVGRARHVEAALQGSRWTRDNVVTAAKELAKDFVPLSDVRGSASFRMTIARNLLLRFWEDVHTGVAAGGEKREA